MRKLLLGALMSVFMINANAQGSSEMEMFQSIFSSEKKMLVVEFMNLSEAEASLFWDVYNAYEVERSELAKRRWEILKKYAEIYDTMDDENAEPLLKESMSLHMATLKLKNKYTKKMIKAVGAKKAAQWIQLENYLDNEISIYIMDNVPFVGELN